MFHRKWKIKTLFFRRAICCMPWSFLNQGVVFLHVSNVLGMYGGMHMWSHASYTKAWNIDELNDTEFPIPKPQNNKNVSKNLNEIQPIITSNASLPLPQDYNNDSEQSQSELQLSPTETDQIANLKKRLCCQSHNKWMTQTK